MLLVPKIKVTDHIYHKISQCWQGFRKTRSSINNILQLATIVNEGFSNKMRTDVIDTDSSKAFDKVNHKLLLHKLRTSVFLL